MCEGCTERLRRAPLAVPDEVRVGVLQHLQRVAESPRDVRERHASVNGEAGECVAKRVATGRLNATKDQVNSMFRTCKQWDFDRLD
jgi:hypothetical protein